MYIAYIVIMHQVLIIYICYLEQQCRHQAFEIPADGETRLVHKCNKSIFYNNTSLQTMQ